MYNNHPQAKYANPPSESDQPTPFVTFLYNKRMQRNQRSQSSEIAESILFNPNSTNQGFPHHKKIFTISYQDAKRLNTQAKIREQMEDYHEQLNKSEERLKMNKKEKTKKRYRIKTIASLHEPEKVPPMVMKIMKETLKHTAYNMWPNSEPEQQEDYGLNIQQAKTYKILNKREKLKIKYSVFQHDNENSPEIAQPKSNSPVRGGGFNVRRNRRTFELIDEGNKQFLNNIFFKKSSLPKKHLINYQFKTKKQTISLHGLKLAKMIACLDIILNSYHLFLQKQQPSVINNNSIIHHKQSAQKFTYYIGKGNNAELLRTILKKRSWWVETNTPLKANLVWSQIKIHKVIQNQQALTKHSNSKSALLEYQKDMKSENSSNLLKTYSKLLYQQQGSNVSIEQQAFGMLFHKQQSKLYYCPLKESEQKLRLKKTTQPQLYHNHFQFNYQIGNKNALYFNLKHYYQYKSEDIWQIVPITYYLQANNQTTFKEFEQKFIELQDNNIWILKPGENSNRGQRITLARSIEQVRVKLQTESKLIVQSYIKNLLLYNGRKFDLRTYLLGVNMNGRMKFYFYEQGYIKTSSFLYSLKNINDKYVHLTNDAIQQNSDQYGKYEQGNKLSYMQFQRYLQNKYSKEGYSIFQLHKIMRSIAIEVVKSSYHKLNTNSKAFCFELFGLDFLIDSQFKPYLLQVNSNPCLQLCSHSLERLIPRMLQNLFRICVDPLFRPQFINNTKSQSYYFYDESFLQKNQFRLIFDQKYDSDPQWERCRRGEQVLRDCNFMEEEDQEQ